MIVVNITVPGLENVYNLNIEEEVTVKEIIEEVSELISQKEHTDLDDPRIKGSGNCVQERKEAQRLRDSYGSGAHPGLTCQISDFVYRSSEKGQRNRTMM